MSDARGPAATGARRKRPLRVVTLTDELGAAGGAEALALEITRRLDSQRYERTYAVSRWPTEAGEADTQMGDLATELEREGITVFRMGRTSAAKLWQWWPLVRMLRNRRVDILHAHMYGSNVWGSIAARLAGVPVMVAHEHTWSYEGQPVRRFLDREVVARLSNVFVACSRDDQRKMTEVEGISPKRTTFIPNGVAMAPREPGRDLRAELGLSESGPVIGTVSNLRPQKALTVLVDAVADLVGEFPELHVLIAGSGPEEQRLRSYIADHGMEDHVTLLGRRSDIWDLLATFDIGVMSSDYEGSPLAVMEYMEARLPIVATAVGGVPDLIEDGVHGVLVPPRDPTALARGISDLLRDRERADRFAGAAQQRRREEFDIDVMVKRVSGLYERLYDEAVQ